MNWLKLLKDKNVSKTPLMMDIRWVLCNHVSRMYDRENTWDRKEWTKYLIESDWALYSILDMVRIFLTERHTRHPIIKLLMEENDKRYE